MQEERGVRRNSHTLSGRLMNGAVSPWEADGSISMSAAASLSPSRTNCIEHRVTKMDTLAGVAIKYGVEVADIRRMNGLAMDLQMFAHKTLQIPLPGRHPPSPVISNGTTENGEKTPSHQSHDILETIQSLKLKPSTRRISSAMCSLQGYYGLAQPTKSSIPEGTEMTVYESGRTLLSEDDTLSLESPTSDPAHSQHHKTRNLVNGFSLQNGDIFEDIDVSDSFIRMRQKADADPSLHTPDVLLKEEINGGAFLGRAAKSLALRPKPGSRTDLDANQNNNISGSDNLVGDVCDSVRKSSSTSNLNESENSSSIWSPIKWSLKPDVIARPIFDGLPKPITGWRNKTALD